MTWWLKALTALPDSGSITSTHTAGHNCQELQDLAPSHTDIQAGKILMYIK